MTMTPPAERPSRRRLPLPMAGRTRGSRSPVTCHLRCGDACAKPAPNHTDNPYFGDVVEAVLSRRAVLGGGAGAVGLLFAGQGLAAAAPAGHPGAGRPLRGTGLPFTPIEPVPATVDALTVPDGYTYNVIIRWGDPVLRGAPPFRPGVPDPEAQAKQFGYNNDYLDILVSRGGTRALLVCNHEYTNEEIMFPPDADPEAVIRTAWAAHGMSVVELRRRGRSRAWHADPGGRRNRRITLDTPFRFDGPAAGSTHLRTEEDPTGTTVRGTLNNCSGGTTPWGTVLSGEENFNQYFVAGGTAREKRYGLGPDEGERNWQSVEPRWDATTPAYANEPNRFGWIVEIDPEDPSSTPRKHTAMGRFKHEGANVIVNDDGHVVAYMGDDERFDYVYRFVSAGTYDARPGQRARRHNLGLLSEGDLSVGRFTGDGLDDGVSDGSGEWIPLTRGGASMVPGFTLEEVLVFTRLAADTVQPTKMDRPEDVQPNLANGRIYVALTNNSQRGTAGRAGVDEANPRPENRWGQVMEISPRGGDHTDPRFAWNLLLICGDPDDPSTYYGGYTGPVSPISCPDNVAFDSEGTLWISTDGQPSSLMLDDGLHKVPLEGPERGHVQQFLAVPAGAETCGPVIHDREGSVFVCVQHPGEEGTWDAPQSRFPDYGKGGFDGPRPSVVQVLRRS